MPRHRYHVTARDVPPIAAARIMGMTLEAFTEKLPDLLKRNFPSPDPTTGNFDTKAIDVWQDLRHPTLLGEEKPDQPLKPQSDIREKMAAANRALQEEIKRRPMTKRERDALEECFHSRPNPVDLTMHRHSSLRWLELHGFITSGGAGLFAITAAGELRWQQISASSS
ncbi:MAG: hypothetical protein K2W78_15190 [Xanthobacteraceae bacterium]|nr:hypothetical protein [Xanthobacteraceae bacterium]